MNSPRSGERIQSSPSAGLSETEREKQSKTLHEGIDLLNQVNLKITHPIVATHSNAASSSGGQQAAFEAVATQHENYMSVHNTKDASASASNLLILCFGVLLYLIVLPQPHNIIR